MDKRSHR